VEEKKENIVFVLDTNAIVRDPQFVGNGIQLFLYSSIKLSLGVCLPEVCEDEVKGLYKRDLIDGDKAIRKIKADIQKKTFWKHSFPTDGISVDSWIEKFNDRIEYNKNHFKIKVLPYPKVDLKEIAQRASARKKPFKESGAGFRDYLIWKSILQILKRTKSKVCFISANTKDFFEQERPHPDLISDLEALGIDPNRLTFQRSIAEVNKKFIIPKLKPFSNLKSIFCGNNPSKFDIREWLEVNLAFYLEFEQVPKYLTKLDNSDIELTFLFLEPKVEVTIDDIIKLKDQEYLIFLHGQYRSTITGDFDIHDCLTDPDLNDLVGGPEHGSLNLAREFDAYFSILVNKKNMEPKKFELNIIENSEMQFWVNSHPFSILSNQISEDDQE
jgi:hypothetical protein